MGKVMSLINMTPDGFADAPYAIPDAEFFDFSHSLMVDTDTVAYGRHTFELFQTLWPPRLENGTEWQKKMAQALADIPKVVYSTTLKTTTWDNSTILPTIDVAHISAYKQPGRGNLLTHGSLQLVAELTAMRLIDDYYFCMQPMLAGKGGVRLFDTIKLDAPLPLKYVDSTQLQSGVYIIHYQRVD